MLNVDRDLLVGKLERLWTWAIDFRENGHFLLGEVELIAEKMRWKKSAKKLMEALCAVASGEQSGFLEKIDNGYQIHNWDKYAGKLIERRRKDRERKSKNYPQNFPDNSAGLPPENNGNESGLIKEENRSSMCYRNPNRNPYPNHTNPSDDLQPAAYTVEGEKQEMLPAENSAFGSVLKAFESKLQVFPSPIIQQTVKDYIAWGMSEDVLLSAVDETALAEGVHSRPKYFTGILQSWKSDGIKNKAQFDAYKAREKTSQEGATPHEYTAGADGQKHDSAGHDVL